MQWRFLKVGRVGSCPLQGFRSSEVIWDNMISIVKTIRDMALSQVRIYRPLPPPTQFCSLFMKDAHSAESCENPFSDICDLYFLSYGLHILSLEKTKL